MRILLVSPHYSPEPFRVADVALGLAARGHEIEVLTGLPNYPAGRFYPGYGLRGPYKEMLNGITVWRALLVPRGGGGAVRLALNYLSFALSATFLAGWLGRRRWDAVFVFQLTPVTVIFPGAMLRALRRLPMVIWVQDLWPESVESSGLARSRPFLAILSMLSGWLYRRADRVLATSLAFKPRLVQRGVQPERIEQLPQWAEELFERPSSIAAPCGAWRRGFSVMFAGNLGRVQGLDTVLDAAAQTLDDPEIRWVFVGDGSARPWLETEVAHRGLRDRVFLLGRHPASAMPSFFAAASAMLVSLKRDETMALTVPAKVQAYLAAGRPILGSIDGEAARVISDSGGGYVAPAGDAVALAEIVRRLKALSEAERAAMGERGRAYANLHFNRERCLDQLERALVTTAKPSSTPPGSRTRCS